MTLTLRESIIAYLRERGAPAPIRDLYERFALYENQTVRAEAAALVDEGVLVRVRRGVYAFSEPPREATVASTESTRAQIAPLNKGSALVVLSHLATAYPDATLIIVDEDGRYVRIEGDGPMMADAGFVSRDILGLTYQEVITGEALAPVRRCWREALGGTLQSLHIAFSGRPYTGTFIPLVQGDHRYAAMLGRPVGATGMREVSRTPSVVYRQGGEERFRLSLVLEATDPVTVDLDLPNEPG